MEKSKEIHPFSGYICKGNIKCKDDIQKQWQHAECKNDIQKQKRHSKAKTTFKNKDDIQSKDDLQSKEGIQNARTTLKMQRRHSKPFLKSIYHIFVEGTLSVCVCVRVCVCHNSQLRNPQAIIYVIVIQLTKEAIRKVWRGRDYIK